jgi:hypothetical protein
MRNRSQERVGEGIAMKGFVVSLFLATFCAAFAGCVSIQHQLGMDVRPQYVELTEAQPGDIPVPDGFTMVTKTKESYSIELANDGFRDAHLVYIGHASARSAARFYQRTMTLPTYGWRDRSERQTEGDRHLRFVKHLATCSIVISRVEIGSEMKTRIEVDIVTKR